MPQIERVTIHQRAITLRRPFVTAVRTATSIDALVVEVLDSEGRSGWGEAPTSWRVTGESVASVTAAIEGPLQNAILGRDNDDPWASSIALESAAARNSSARMALDCALFDLAAQARGITLHDFLGGTRVKVRSDMTLSAALRESDLDDLVRVALEHVAEGFRTLKVKVGAGGDDVAALSAVRDAVGAQITLRVDANQGWTAQEAVRVIGACEDAGVDLEMVEQPVHRDDIDGLAFVTQHVHTTVMADEAVWTRREFREIIRSHAADMINIKLAKTGGLSGALELLADARRNQVDVIIGCMAETHVGIGAAAALASVVDTDGTKPSRAHDLDGGLWLTRSPVEGGVSYEGDGVVLASAPGIGITGLAPRGV